MTEKSGLLICGITQGRLQSKTFILSTNVNQKSLETVFSIVICRPNGDKWQLKTLFLAIFDPHWSIFKSIYDCRLPGVDMHYSKHYVKVARTGWV